MDIKSPPNIEIMNHATGAGILSEERWAEIARFLQLSRRELQLTRAVFDDATDVAIAADLGISPHTVHAHFRRLYRRLGVRTRARLVVRVVQTGQALDAGQGRL